jgi:hypothetical protein
MNFKAGNPDGVDWIHLAWRRTVMNVVMDLLVP